MKNIPEVGKAYTDRDGISVTVIQVIKTSGGGGAMRRKSKNTGYSVVISNGKYEAKIGLNVFHMRGFKECTSL